MLNILNFKKVKLIEIAIVKGLIYLIHYYQSL